MQLLITKQEVKSESLYATVGKNPDSQNVISYVKKNGSRRRRTAPELCPSRDLTKIFVVTVYIYVTNYEL